MITNFHGLEENDMRRGDDRPRVAPAVPCRQAATSVSLVYVWSTQWRGAAQGGDSTVLCLYACSMNERADEEKKTTKWGKLDGAFAERAFPVWLPKRFESGSCATRPDPRPIRGWKFVARISPKLSRSLSRKVLQRSGYARVTSTWNLWKVAKYFFRSRDSYESSLWKFSRAPHCRPPRSPLHF